MTYQETKSILVQQASGSDLLSMLEKLPDEINTDEFEVIRLENGGFNLFLDQIPGCRIVSIENNIAVPKRVDYGFKDFENLSAIDVFEASLFSGSVEYSMMRACKTGVKKSALLICGIASKS